MLKLFIYGTLILTTFDVDAASAASARLDIKPGVAGHLESTVFASAFKKENNASEPTPLIFPVGPSCVNFFPFKIKFVLVSSILSGHVIFILA